MVILLNKKANSGSAAIKWNKIKDIILGKFPDSKIIEAGTLADIYIVDAIANGETDFISAGGDGTLNFLLNVLMKDSALSGSNNFRVGAIGLGSSNDFQKPYDKFINSIPVRIDFDNCESSDVGVIEYEDEELFENKKYWVLNSSIGILADANKYFNHYGIIWDYFKRNFVGGAIMYSAISTILKYKNKKCVLSAEKIYEGKIEFSNIGITKNPNFAGDFSYPEPYYPSNGLFGLHIIEKSNLKKLLITLFRLWNNKSRPVASVNTREAEAIEVSSENPVAVEFDGEVISTKKVKFSLMNKAVKLCK